MNNYKQINENWQKFLSEAPDDDVELPEPEEDPHSKKLTPDEVSARKAQADASKDRKKVKVAGINSTAYPDSLINMLNQSGLAKSLSRAQIDQLLTVMAQNTVQDDIVLEALGAPAGDSRTYSPEATRRLNDLIRSFNLSPDINQKLEKLIMRWAKLNTVKFSPTSAAGPTPPTPPSAPASPPSAATPVGDDEDTSDDPTETEPLPKLGTYEEIPAEFEDDVIRGDLQAQYPVAYQWWESRPDSERKQLYALGEKGMIRKWMEAGEPSRHVGQGWDAIQAKWITDLTPEKALDILLTYKVETETRDTVYKKTRKQLEHLEDLIERGGGLMFGDFETGDLNIVPKWTLSPEPQYKGSYEISPSLPQTGIYILVPRALKNFWRKIKDDILAVFGRDRFKTNLQDPSPEEQEYLKIYTKKFKKQFKGRRKPEDPENLEESFDRLQTLAGIKKRIL